MTIDRDYMLRKPPGPSATQLFVDTRIVPLVVNMAWDLEVTLNRASVRTGLRPAIIVCGATGILFLTLLRLFRDLRGAADA